MFRGIHPRLSGIGIASIWSGFIIVIYYIPIIAYAIYYFALSFVSPIAWSSEGIKDIRRCPGLAPATEYFYVHVLKAMREDTCQMRTPGDTEGIAWGIFLCNTVAWLITFVCVMRGVKTSSYIVWISVPLPLILIIVMIIRGNTLDGSEKGIELYLSGDASKTFAEQLSAAGIWNDAVSQIFFSIGVCMGIMTSYGSYNKRDKPVLVDSFLIGIINSGISFLAGFAVFSIIGYLQAQNSPVSSETGGFGLAFIAWPTAANALPGANWWNLCLFGNLIFLGLDSAFSLVEAVATVIHDTQIGRKFRRWVIAAVICGVGIIWGFLFCADIGLFILDVMDYYINGYTLLLVGIL